MVQDWEVGDEDMGKEENEENLKSGCNGCKATAKQANQEIRKLERSSKTVKRGLGKTELDCRRQPQGGEPCEHRVQGYMMKLQEKRMAEDQAKGEENRIAGETFLAENGKKVGMVTTESSLLD